MDFVDKPKAIRSGEELDISRVEEYLKDSIPGLSGPCEVSQFPSGHSNLTYFIKVGDREMVLRRPPFGRKAETAHDMGREYKILTALHPVFPYCPKPLAYTGDESVLGCPFYVMERLRGIILRKDFPKELQLPLQDAAKLCEELIDVQVALHKVDYKKVGLESFGKPEGYTRRQIEGWSKRYRQARTPDAPDLEYIMSWLADNIPPETGRAAVIHGDYKLDNVVLDPSNPLKIIGILDWEMATIGDPIMDLGASMSYWVEAGDPPDFEAMRMMPTNAPGMLSRKQLVARYEEKAGIKIDNFDFYLCYGMFRLCGIGQQIYYRYYHGQTKDKRFVMFIFAVHILEKAIMRVIKGDGWKS